MTDVVTKILDRDAGVTSPLELLSLRQREILQMIAEGQSTKEISYRLNLSAKTVETHRRVLMQRLDIHEVAGLARFAVRSGLVALDAEAVSLVVSGFSRTGPPEGGRYVVSNRLRPARRRGRASRFTRQPQT